MSQKVSEKKGQREPGEQEKQKGDRWSGGKREEKRERERERKNEHREREGIVRKATDRIEIWADS